MLPVEKSEERWVTVYYAKKESDQRGERTTPSQCISIAALLAAAGSHRYVWRVAVASSRRKGR